MIPTFTHQTAIKQKIIIQNILKYFRLVHITIFRTGVALAYFPIENVKLTVKRKAVIKTSPVRFFQDSF